MTALAPLLDCAPRGGRADASSTAGDQRMIFPSRTITPPAFSPSSTRTTWTVNVSSKVYPVAPGLVKLIDLRGSAR